MNRVKQFAIVLLLGCSLPTLAWHLEATDQRCDVSKTVEFQSRDKSTLVDVKFTFNEAQQVLFSLQFHDNKSAALPVMTFADSEYVSDDLYQSFRLNHKESREILLLFSDYADAQHAHIDLGVSFATEPNRQFNSLLAPDVITELKNNQTCFDHLNMAISQI